MFFLQKFCVFSAIWVFSKLAVAAQETAEMDYFENYYNEIDSTQEHSQERNAVRWDVMRWPQNTVPYQISENYTAAERNMVRNALQVFDSNTCVKFVELNKRSELGARYLYFDKRNAYCGTKVGYQPGDDERHNLYLSSLCLTLPGAVQHESLHVLGLFHEQSRPDRDEYDWGNVPTKNWHNFAKIPEVYATTYNVPYDFGSIMHYSEYAFSKNPKKPSMRVKTGKTNPYSRMGQLNSPSKSDYDKVNQMYSC